MKKYNIIYSDFPWKYNSRANHKTRFRGGAEGHYPLMTMEEIKKLPIPDLGEKNSALLLWCTYPYLNDQIELFKYWGFRYRTIFINWTKLNPTGYDSPLDDPKYSPNKTYVTYNGKYHSVFFGVGYYTKSNPEPLLLGIRGRMETITDSVSNTLFAPRREHSRKPDEARERIVQVFGDLPRVELFARPPLVTGWDSYGNAVNGEDIREVLKKAA